MPDSSDAFSAAMAELDAATAVVKNMIQLIENGARVLQKWQTVAVVNIPEGNSLPGIRPSGTINGLTWPTAQELGDALTRYHAALKKAQHAWTPLSDQIKQSVPRPS
jgi:hypothetical protein